MPSLRVFAQCSKGYLVDDDWKLVEIEPETVETNGNGHHANGVEPSVEFVMGNNGHAANGAGHHDESEPQQTRFSWAEFMAEEPVKPKGRGRKAEPSSLSLFDWGARPGTGAGGGVGRPVCRLGGRGALDWNAAGAATV